MNIVEQLSWDDESALFPGSHSTLPNDEDEDIPWKCISEIVPGLFLTCEIEVADRNVSIQKGICLLINLCGAEHVSPYKVYEFDAEGKPQYRRLNNFDEFISELHLYSLQPAPSAHAQRKVFINTIPAIDSPQYEIDKHFPELCTLIHSVHCNRASIENTDQLTYDQFPAVVVHCMVGVSRSASVVIAYLMKRTGMSRDQAILFTQSTRPVVNPNPGFRQQLLLWENTGCRRVFDEFSARLVSQELRQRHLLLPYVNSQLPIFLQHGKCSQDRKYIGFIIANAAPSPDEIVALYREFRSYVTAAIDSEVYVDTPSFFGYIGEVVHSFHEHIPEILLSATLTRKENEVIWSDQMYNRMIKDIGRSGFVKDSYDTIRAFCSLLEAINVKHFKLLEGTSPCPLNVNPADCHCLERVSLSFPFLTSLASYAEGFVQFSELNTLHAKYPNEGAPMGREEANQVAAEVTDLFLGSFLVSSCGVRSDVCNQRWNPNSPLLYLRDDVEVMVFEMLLNNPSDLRQHLDSTIENLFSNVTDCNVGLILAQKAVSGIVAFRLLLETVEEFVVQAYANRSVKRHDLNVCDERMPLTMVWELLRLVENAYNAAYTCNCDLVSFFKSDLEPLSNAGVMREEGLWSSLQNC